MSSMPDSPHVTINAPKEDESTPLMYPRRNSLRRPSIVHLKLHPPVAFKLTMKSLAISGLIIFFIYSSFLMVYFGAMLGMETRYPKLPFLIMNNDVPPEHAPFSMGQNVAREVSSIASPYKHGSTMFHFIIKSSMTYEETLHQVSDMHYWGALYIPSNYTARLVDTLAGAMAPYDDSVTFIYDTGRQFQTVSNIKNLFRPAIAALSRSIGVRLLSGAFNVSVDLAAVGDASALVDPVAVAEADLHPVPSLFHSFATYIGYIILWVSSILVVNSVYESSRVLENDLAHFSWNLIAFIRIACAMFAGLFTSALLVIMTNSMGLRYHSGWFAYWMFTWLVSVVFMGVIASIKSMLGHFGVMIVTLSLYLQITSSDAIYTAQVMYPFYRYVGIVLPMHHAVQGSRYLAFGAANQLPFNIAVLLGWLVICVTLVWIGIVRRIKHKLVQTVNSAPAVDIAVSGVSMVHHS